MSDNKRTLRINPQLFKLNGGKKKDRSMKRSNKTRPIVDAESASKANKVKKEMLKPSKLLETVLKRIIVGVKKINKNIVSVDVSIKKLSPPVSGNVDSVELRKKV